MRYFVFILFVVVTLSIIFHQAEAISGTCTCMCCIGQGCRPAILPSIPVDDCSLCTDQECRTVYPDNCPSESTAGSTNTRCIEDTTTTTTTTTARPKPDGCFASNSIVRLVDDRIKNMSDLVEGDLVFVKRNEEIIESPILVVFRHYRSSTRFLDIYTARQMIPLRLTPLHSLLVLPKYDTRARYSFAKDLFIGDFVFSSDLLPLKVINIKEVIVYNDSGYAPLTFEGNIIINDLTTSCYAKYDHSTMHIITTPIRWWFFVLFKYQQFPYFDYLQKLTTDIIVSFIDFDLR